MSTKTLFFLLQILAFTFCVSCSGGKKNMKSLQKSQKEHLEIGTGIIYGPTAAYKIKAPTDWILDRKAGESMGLACVIYPYVIQVDKEKKQYEVGPTKMYAKIAPTEFKDIDTFIDFAIKEFEQSDPNFNYKAFKTGQLDKQKYVVMDYQGGPDKNYERVFYVQMKKAVGYVVFTAPNEAEFDKYSDAIFEVIESYQYKPSYIGFKENK